MVIDSGGAATDGSQMVHRGQCSRSGAEGLPRHVALLICTSHALGSAAQHIGGILLHRRWRMDRNLKWGLIGSGIYAALWVGYCVWSSDGLSRWDEFKHMDLNELGDFLAGFGGPLAVVWLIFGFHQQGAVLNLQTTELKKSIEQQSESLVQQSKALDQQRELLDVARQEHVANLELIKLQRDALAAEQAAMQPQLMLRPDRAVSESLKWELELANGGMDCSNIRASVSSPNVAYVSGAFPIHHLRRGDKVALIIQLRGSTELQLNLYLEYDTYHKGAAKTVFMLGVKGHELKVLGRL